MSSWEAHTDPVRVDFFRSQGKKSVLFRNEQKNPDKLLPDI
jgi:hypothetical protein